MRSCRHVGARVLAALFCACALGVSSARAQDRTADSLEVRHVDFVGARAFRKSELQAAIVTSPSRCKLPVVLLPVCLLGAAQQKEYIDEDAVRADALRLRLFYYQRGYRDAKVDSRMTRKPEGVDVAFSITEGRPVIIEALELEGAPAILSPDVVSQIPLGAHRPLDMILYEATRDSLQTRLNNVGYAHAEMLASYLIPTDSPYQARVKYEALPGVLARFGPVDVQGAQKVSPTVVRRMLTFRPGDLYRQEELAKSQRNLFGLEVFQHADIHPHLDALPDSIVPVTVQVNEGNLHRVRVGAGLSTTEAFNAEGRWTSRNFFGGARHLELRMGLSNILAPEFDIIPFFDTGKGRYGKPSGVIGADFSQPWFFDPLNTFGAGLFAERQSIPNVFVRTAEGGYLSLSRPLGAGTNASIGYRPELTSLDAEGDLIFCVSFVTCAAQDIQVLRDRHWLAPLTLAFSRNRTNSLFAPTRGYILRFDGEYAARLTGSQFSYTRIIGELSHYLEVMQGVVFATRVRPAWAHAIADRREAGLGLHPQKRFFAGGPNSVRGFAQYRLGPKVLSIDAFDLLKPTGTFPGCTAQQVNAGACDANQLDDNAFDVRPTGGAAMMEGNLELRFPLFADKLRGAAFMDVGQVWSTASDVRIRSLAWTPGFGIRYFSPIGPIRIDVGYNGTAAEPLPLITTELCVAQPNGAPCTPLVPGQAYTPTQLERGSTLRRQDAPVLWEPGGTLFKRFQLHFSIGQAF
jgi:outer membrane protein assembly factor BamA